LGKLKLYCKLSSEKNRLFDKKGGFSWHLQLPKLKQQAWESTFCSKALRQQGKFTALI